MPVPVACAHAGDCACACVGSGGCGRYGWRRSGERFGARTRKAERPPQFLPRVSDLRLELHLTNPKVRGEGGVEAWAWLELRVRASSS